MLEFGISSNRFCDTDDCILQSFRETRGRGKYCRCFTAAQHGPDRPRSPMCSTLIERDFPNERGTAKGTGEGGAMIVDRQGALMAGAQFAITALGRSKRSATLPFSWKQKLSTEPPSTNVISVAAPRLNTGRDGGLGHCKFNIAFEYPSGVFASCVRFYEPIATKPFVPKAANYAALIPLITCQSADLYAEDPNRDRTLVRHKLPKS
jgi:hypothetical protein